MYLKITPKYKLSPKAIIVAHPLDIRLFFDKVHIKAKYNLPLSKLYVSEGFSLAGPCLGGPQIMLIIEHLIAWGIKEIIFFGWCSGLQLKIKIGHIILPNAGIKEDNILFKPDKFLFSKTIQALNGTSLTYYLGTVYSTDNPYAETTNNLEKLREKNILAMDMETADFLKISNLKGISANALLIVSDELNRENWETGFTKPIFKASRKLVANILISGILI
jgi:purine-nucleoside phosphorylase